MAKKYPTNVEFITELMQFANSGPLMQGFILEGMRLYSEEVKKADLSSMDGGFIDGTAWKACALEYLEAIDKQHNS